MSKDLEQLWDVRELCARLRVARSTVYDWVHMGFIPHVRLGSCVRFRPADVVVWIDQNAKPGRKERVPAVSVADDPLDGREVRLSIECKSA